MPIRNMSETPFENNLRRFLQLVFCMFAVLALTACASGPKTINVQQQVFQNWPLNHANATYKYPHLEQYDLEGQTYLKMMDRHLDRVGLQPARADKDAGFDVELRYAVIPKQELIADDSDPYFYGGYGWGGWGRWRHPYYAGFGMPMGYRQSLRTVNYNRYVVRVDILQNSPSRPVYQATVATDSESLNLPQVMPYLIQSAFAGFPGHNGQVTELKLPLIMPQMD